MKQLVKTMGWLSFILLIMGFGLKQDNDYRTDRIRESWSAYQAAYHHQKVYVHTDKEVYELKDNIWFQAYVLSEDSLLWDDYSDNLYVELLNFKGQITRTKILRIENGQAQGDFFVHDTIPHGYYTLRAYTTSMRNYADDYWFHKEIKINNPQRILYKFQDRRQAKKSLRQARVPDVQFLPEGGQWVAGLENKVAIKAVAPAGHGVAFQGRIVNSNKQTVAEVASDFAGMTQFSFTPKAGEQYKALLEFESGKTRKWKLPEVQSEGVVLSADAWQQPGQIDVAVHANSPLSSDPRANQVYLVGMVRNNLQWIKKYDLREAPVKLTLNRNDYPLGIMQLTLMDYQLRPLAERLVFVGNRDYLRLHVKNKQRSASRDSFRVHYQLAETGEKLPPGSRFSAAVIEQQGTRLPQTAGITSHLLLKSDLQGFIEHPDWYFEEDNPTRRKALDNLLLTQGWRRFTWSEVLDGSWAEPEFSPENHLTVTGQITRDIIKVPFKDIKVEMVVLSEFNESFVTRTDEEGRFAFDDLIYSDTVDVLVRAEKPNGRDNNILVWIDDDNQPQGPYHIRHPQELVSNFKHRKHEPKPYNAYKSGSHSLHSSADQVIDFSKMNTSGYNSVMNVLKGRVPGLSVTPGGTNIRGINSFYLSSEPLYLIDGMPVDRAAIESLSVSDVDRIEILKNPANTGIYGINGANGVIAVHTKRGHHVIHGRREFQMLGYYTSREFYIPRYPAPDNQPPRRLMKTIHWQPHLQPNSKGELQLRFPTRGATGNYQVVLQGVIPGKGPVEKVVDFSL